MIRRFDRGRWSLDSLAPPWGDLDSIYLQIRHDGVMKPLPDDRIVFRRNELRWVGGALDGVLGHSAEGAESRKRIFGIVGALQQLQQRAGNQSLRSLYETVIDGAIVDCIDAVLEQLTDSSAPDDGDSSRLLEIGRYFATRAGHREAVKFGLALIGIAGTTKDGEILKTLGAHEEFTLFAALALARTADNPEQALWELAKTVHGWGRIQIVRRLKDTYDPEIQAWMLREGFRNTIMDEYLACICARAGRLHEALNQQFVEAPLFDAAADIIRALITGGPAEDIDDYEFSADACESYLNIAWSSPDLSLKHFLAIAKLRWFLAEAKGWEKRHEFGWTDSRRKSMQALAEEVFGREKWGRQAADALASSDERIFDEGDQVAQWLSIDTWELHFVKVQADPLGSPSWYRLMSQTDEVRLDRILTFAESVLPFEQIETGPGDELGLGVRFRPHEALDWILQDLRRFPKRGWRLIRAGLNSPVVRNRNMAINALAAWPRDSWTAEMRSVIERARDTEPEEGVRLRFNNLLAGNPVS
jgi:hypothetical protein